MIHEKVTLNLPLLPATLANGMKYGVSGLRIVRLSNNQFGAVENAELFSEANSENPYPLVSGKDLYGRNLIVPLYIKGKEDTVFLQEAIVNVSRKRNIVATPVLNGHGTVKEMITDDDLTLSISAAVVSTTCEGDYDNDGVSYNDTYPYNGVERLRKLLEEPNRLDVVSDFLTLFDLNGGDFGIVVTSYSVNQETHTNRQVFSIEAVSDYDYNLLIEE